MSVLIALWLLSWLGANWLIVSQPLSHADVIVVMAGSAAYKERAQLAAELYRKGRAEKIIVTNDNHRSGWAADEQRNIPYQELAERWLRDQGVPAATLVPLSQPVNSTYSESVLLREYAESHQLHSLLIVTSAYHSRRARWTLQRVFANSGITLGIETAKPGWQSPRAITWWLHLRGWQMIPLEYVKLIYYRLAY